MSFLFISFRWLSTRLKEPCERLHAGAPNRIHIGVQCQCILPIRNCSDANVLASSYPQRRIRYCTS